MYKELKKTSPNHLSYAPLKLNFNTYCKILRKSMTMAKKLYYHSQLELNKKDSRKTWEIINSLLNVRKRKKQFPSFFLVNNQKLSNQEQIANNFNKFFANIGHMLASNIRTNNLPLFSSFLGNPLQENFTFTLVQSPEIQKIINNFKSKSSVGSDNLSMKLFKRISNTIVIPLTFIINQSLTTGIFPNDLKIAKILP